jgi:hypothetical protein
VRNPSQPRWKLLKDRKRISLNLCILGQRAHHECTVASNVTSSTAATVLCETQKAAMSRPHVN